MTNPLYKREEILKDLKFNVIEVSFDKVDGTKRLMKCTLMPEYCPPKTDFGHLEEQHKKPENLDVIAAWDIEVGGWRSFRIDSVHYVQILPNYA